MQNTYIFTQAHTWRKKIIESLKLVEISKVIQSNLWPNTTVVTTPQHMYHIQSFFELFQGWDGDPTTSLGSLFQNLTTLSVKKFFLIVSLVHLEAINPSEFAFRMAGFTELWPELSFKEPDLVADIVTIMHSKILRIHSI